MSISFAASAIAVLLAATTLPAGAGVIDDFFHQYRNAVQSGERSASVVIDNDSLLLNKDDGFYSSGFKADLRYTRHGTSRSTTYGWRLGQDLYTASDIKLPPSMIAPNDHPYAGWLYTGFYRESHVDDGRSFKAGIDVGCLGRCAGGEWTQKTLHRLLDQPLPAGWDHQIKSEFGVMLHAEQSAARWSIAPYADLTPSARVRLGNVHTDASAGLRLRVGHLNGLPRQDTLHGFMRVEGSAVGYNATLQGGYFSDGDPHTVSPRRFVSEAEVGMVWKKGSLGTGISLVRRSSEVRGLSNSQGAQNFLRLTAQYAF